MGLRLDTAIFTEANITSPVFSGRKGNKTKQQLERYNCLHAAIMEPKFLREKRTRCYLPGLKVMSDDKNEGAAGWDF